MARAAIGLGSNLGDRSEHLAAAVAGLERLGTVVAVSSSYETAPVGGPGQDDYLNAVALLDTDLAPAALLDGLLAIERERGRERTERWGPRTIDLDLLLFGDEAIDEPGLTVPHPRMTERRFVLDPLLEVWPYAELPDGTPLVSFRDAVADQDVRRLPGPIPTPPAETTDDEFHPGAAWIIFITVIIAATAIWWLLDWLLRP